MGRRLADGSLQDSCLDKVQPGEPIFVLRGQDKMAPALVRAWAALAVAHGVGVEKTEEAMMTANEMERWFPRKWPD